MVDCRIGAVAPMSDKRSAAPRERLCIDLRGPRGLRAALCAQAKAQGLTPSAFVRAALLATLGAAQTSIATASADAPNCKNRQRLSLRLRRSDARALQQAAQAAGLALSDYLPLLLDRASVAGDAAKPAALLPALHASCAELATPSRNLHRLTTLLRQGSSEAASTYRQVLDTLREDLRSHLSMASGVLAELRPSRRDRVPAEASDTRPDEI